MVTKPFALFLVFSFMITTSLEEVVGGRPVARILLGKAKRKLEEGSCYGIKKGCRSTKTKCPMDCKCGFGASHCSVQQDEEIKVTQDIQYYCYGIDKTCLSTATMCPEGCDCRDGPGTSCNIITPDPTQQQEDAIFTQDMSPDQDQQQEDAIFTQDTSYEQTQQQEDEFTQDTSHDQDQQEQQDEFTQYQNDFPQYQQQPYFDLAQEAQQLDDVFAQYIPYDPVQEQGDEFTQYPDQNQQQEDTQ